MVKGYRDPYGFQNRKQHYRSGHRGPSVPGGLISVFSENPMRFIAITVAVLAVLTAALVVLFAPPAEAEAQEPVSSSTASPVADNASNADTGTDEPSISAGLAEDAGEGDGDIVAPPPEGDTSGETGGETVDGAGDGTDVSDTALLGSIGVVFDNVSTERDKNVLQQIEIVADMAKKAGRIGAVKYYNAKGDLNQQLQDMRSMINSSARAIILDVADRETYIMMTDMARDANIPVVAIEAPVTEGYAVNIRADTSRYGQKSAAFLKQKAGAGNVLEIYGQKTEGVELQRINMLQYVIASSSALKSVGNLALENKTAKIKAATDPLVQAGTTLDVVIAGQGMAKNALNVLLADKVIPKVFLGDATTGFIKLWHSLKTDGVKISVPAEKQTSKSSAKPSPETVTMKLTGAEAFCAEAVPYGEGGAALQFALSLKDGKVLKSTALINNTYIYTPSMLITDENLEAVYQQYKDATDETLISSLPTDAEMNALFEEAPQESAQPTTDQ